MASSSSTPPHSNAPAASSDSNPNSSQLPERIRILKIRVVSAGLKTVTFKFKSHLPLKMLVDEYFKMSSLLPGDVGLIYNGERLNVQRTANELGMKDNATIEAMRQFHGGGMKFQTSV